MRVLYTVGHSTLSTSEFIGLVRNAGVDHVIDVRLAPRSRRHPQFQREALAESLAKSSIAYAWEGEDLGGFRKPRGDSRHTALRNESFRGYADHMETPKFRAALGRVLDLAADRPTAVMCAEAVWWRCHRGLIADAVVAKGHRAVHVMSDGSLRQHTLRDFVRLEDGWPVYDANQPTLDDAGSG